MKFLEFNDIQPIFIPVDLNDGAITGDYVSLKGHHGVGCLLIAGDGSAGNDLTVSVFQAKDVAGTDAKVLNALVTGRIYTKEHASAFSSIGTWTKETQATADEQFTKDDSGEQVNAWLLELLASDLDVHNDFDCIRMDVADPGAAKIGAGVYLLHGSRDKGAPELKISPIID